MQITLPPELETLVQRQINSGTYDNAIDVLLAGVQLLEQEPLAFPEENLAELKRAVQIGWKLPSGVKLSMAQPP